MLLSWACIGGEVFCQKHAETTKLPGLTEQPASLWPGHSRLLTVDSADALIGAAQLNVVETGKHLVPANAR
ncbi:hypothetical protein AWV80_32955 [Cupriavidus sp. UYMU48A]|nr:hypothetical protein AWV80_32955 [Cupriavidus sp. UYMU48A]